MQSLFLPLAIKLPLAHEPVHGGQKMFAQAAGLLGGERRLRQRHEGMRVNTRAHGGQLRHRGGRLVHVPGRFPGQAQDKINIDRLPVPRLGARPDASEISDALEVLRSIGDVSTAAFTSRNIQALRHLFIPAAGAKRLELPGGLAAERHHRAVVIRRG